MIHAEETGGLAHGGGSGREQVWSNLRRFASPERWTGSSWLSMMPMSPPAPMVWPPQVAMPARG